MREFLIRRLVQSALLLWVLMTFVFFLTRLTPGGPEAALLEQPRMEKVDIERLRERFGLNDPPHIAYAKWLANAVRLDFGRSYFYLRPPMDVIKERLGATVQLSALAILIGMIGIPLGLIAAMNRGRLPDLAIRVFTVLGDSAPHWWLALVVIVLMARYVGWFPQGQGRDGPLEWFSHIIVPALILALGGIVGFSRYVRSQVLEVIGQDYVRTARAKGLPEFRPLPAGGGAQGTGLRERLTAMERTVLWGHVLRNELLPIVTIFGGLLPALISGAAIMESIFNWPGMGRLFLDAALTRDYPLLLAIITFSTIATLLGILLADLSYGLVDPRIRYR